MNKQTRQFNIWMNDYKGIGLAPVTSVFGVLLAKELSTNDKRFNKL